MNLKFLTFKIFVLVVESELLLRQICVVFKSIVVFTKVIVLNK